MDLDVHWGYDLDFDPWPHWHGPKGGVSLPGLGWVFREIRRKTEMHVRDMSPNKGALSLATAIPLSTRSKCPAVRILL